ncbi:hypothetical protein [Pseudorhodoferax soli]|uniref:Uncharacterized protein n=1 Tax=Pseudorhodoferax soli TaxID=545864 RepID=A0A368XQ12_9BURK|nr:hypothetical protein [Pseudorhodoferax soli]RCW70102.1 hypothetical protein DES41_10538 [Pseudorhodoferax soli]
MHFDSNGNPVQPSGFRQSRITGALQFVATPNTTMTQGQWARRVDEAGAMADQTLDNAERVTVVGPGSRDVRFRVGGR